MGGGLHLSNDKLTILNNHEIEVGKWFLFVLIKDVLAGEE